MRQWLLCVIATLAFCNVDAASAAEIRVVIGLRLAPYVMEGKVDGVEYEYVELIMHKLGYEMKPTFVQLKDVGNVMMNGQADMALTSTGSVVPTAFVLSKPYVAYRNAAITLKRRQLTIHSLDDLKPLSIAAFENAPLYLGTDFAAIVANKKDYSEYANQLAQNVLLYQGKVDVVVADVNIFAYLDDVVRAHHSATIQPVSFAHLFPPSAYCIAFRDPALRDRFDAVLGHAHQLKGYAAIGGRWQSRIGQPIDQVLLQGEAPAR
jgi:polar amino acid transport system substrate-binding protein